MKFGTFITRQRGDVIAADVRAAEQLGFESAWIAEHLIMPVNQTSAYPYTADGRFLVPPDAPFLDPLLTLAYVAALTTKIRLATGIFVLPLRNAFA
ncbi:MAG: LLM class flavin-dependent oxidoreductase, partial [Candidatus Binataceae bacterium]